MFHFGASARTLFSNESFLKEVTAAGSAHKSNYSQSENTNQLSCREEQQTN